MEMVFAVFFVLVLGISTRTVDGAVSQSTMKKIDMMNKKGPYLGIVVPNSFELTPLLESASFVADQKLPTLDFSGRRFRFGRLDNQSVVITMTGLSMLNAGVTTQLLLSLFKVKGVVHYGIAGNADPQLQIGDVTIPQYWAHTGLWNWQRFGDGPDDLLSLEPFGDYTRDVGYIKFSDYNNKTVENSLNNAWYQPEEIFPVFGTPEVRQHAFWVPVNRKYFALAQQLLDLKLESCVNTTCLPRTPIIMRVERGISANVFVDNRAYRQFLNTKFNATAIDMESAAVALVCKQQKKPFIVIRALSDLAGGGSSVSNEASTFASLAAQNAVTVVLKFISLLSP
ncbi:PREDICTED: bark storage protein A [Fragaria vesca subsp. vesca]|uniref:bark storage protein A n=1 Tax=Fragaria vesca subsp. vesca TaxID=101020 RepID=UPI0002C36756|nr:PREDICTED: bark storage protein A [Fragaria vesca subsp. vesca]